jgi:hypothetical protein
VPAPMIITSWSVSIDAGCASGKVIVTLHFRQIGCRVKR